MRECWINVSVVPMRTRKLEAVLGSHWGTRSEAVAVGQNTDYRLHVRLKVPALPATDALAAVKAGEDERRRHHGA